MSVYVSVRQFSLGRNEDEEMIKDAFGSISPADIAKLERNDMPLSSYSVGGTCAYVRANMYACMHVFMYVSLLVFSHDENLKCYHIPNCLRAISPVGGKWILGKGRRMEWLHEVRTVHYIIILPIAIFPGDWGKGDRDKNHSLSDTSLRKNLIRGSINVNKVV